MAQLFLRVAAATPCHPGRRLQGAQAPGGTVTARVAPSGRGEICQLCVVCVMCFPLVSLFG